MSALILQYRDGYKGQVAKSLRNIQTPIRPAKDIVTEFIELTMGGFLSIKSAYAYDFVSGGIDWPEWVKAASLLHDAICQLHAEGHITDEQRKQGDKWFKDILMVNNKWMWVRWNIWYRGVRIGSKDGSSVRPIHKVKLKLPETRT